MKNRKAFTYSLMDQVIASPVEPLPISKRTHQLTVMNQALMSMCEGLDPSVHDWRSLSDAVNLMETLVEQGEVEDANGLLQDAIQALAEAGIRHRQGHPLRLSGPGMQAVRGVLEDYSEVIAALPARTMIRAHRLTEKRNFEILAGKSRPTDIRV